MASGSSWQQYYCPAGQGKFSTSTATSMSFQTGITMEYTQDLHLKMSKKIAQLTKVRGVNARPVRLSSPRRVSTLPLRFDPGDVTAVPVRSGRQTPFEICTYLVVICLAVHLPNGHSDVFTYVYIFKNVVLLLAFVKHVLHTSCVDDTFPIDSH